MREGDDQIKGLCMFTKLDPKAFQRLLINNHIPVKTFEEFDSFLVGFIRMMEEDTEMFIQITGHGKRAVMHCYGKEWNMVMNLSRLSNLDMVDYLTDILHAQRQDHGFVHSENKVKTEQMALLEEQLKKTATKFAHLKNENKELKDDVGKLEQKIQCLEDKMRAQDRVKSDEELSKSSAKVHKMPNKSSIVEDPKGSCPELTYNRLRSPADFADETKQTAHDLAKSSLEANVAARHPTNNDEDLASKSTETDDSNESTRAERKRELKERIRKLEEEIEARRLVASETESKPENKDRNGPEPDWNDLKSSSLTEGISRDNLTPFS